MCTDSAVCSQVWNTLYCAILYRKLVGLWKVMLWPSFKCYEYKEHIHLKVKSLSQIDHKTKWKCSLYTCTLEPRTYRKLVSKAILNFYSNYVMVECWRTSLGEHLVTEKTFYSHLFNSPTKITGATVDGLNWLVGLETHCWNIWMTQPILEKRTKWNKVKIYVWSAASPYKEINLPWAERRAKNFFVVISYDFRTWNCLKFDLR